MPCVVIVATLLSSDNCSISAIMYYCDLQEAKLAWVGLERRALWKNVAPEDICLGTIGTMHKEL